MEVMLSRNLNLEIKIKTKHTLPDCDFLCAWSNFLPIHCFWMCNKLPVAFYILWPRSSRKAIQCGAGWVQWCSYGNILILKHLKTRLMYILYVLTLGYHLSQQMLGGKLNPHLTACKWRHILFHGLAVICLG
jgi:hypothetical protein